MRSETQLKEHTDACRKRELEKSVIAEHSRKNHHPILWEETSVIDRASKWREVHVKLHIYISHLRASASIEM